MSIINNKEIWKDIKNYEGIYQVSNLGNVKSLNRYTHHYSGCRRLVKEIILKPRLRNHYLGISLSVDGVRIDKNIHRLVALSFIKNTKNKDFVNHMDGNKLNNHANNLEWVTHKENAEHACLLGLLPIKAVNQLSMDGVIIFKHKSIREAERKTGVSRVTIPKVCNGVRNHAGGFKWEFN